MYFQDLIAKLNEYWAEKGCLIIQGYDLEVGAGTFNPATFLRVLGRSRGGWPMSSLPAPDRRKVRRKSEPSPALLPVPGHPQALPLDVQDRTSIRSATLE